MRLYLIIILSLTLHYSIAQKIKVVEEKQNLDGYPLQGYSVVIDLDLVNTKKKWLKQLKTYGKVKKENHHFEIKPANIAGMNTALTMLRTTTTETSNGLKVWLHITSDTIKSTALLISERDAGQMLQDFAANAYKDNINDQIKDSESALRSAAKNLDREQNKEFKIAKKIEANKAEKIKLEDKLKQNAIDAIQYDKDKENNKVDVQKATAEIERMKKATEIVKAKLNEIN